MARISVYYDKDEKEQFYMIRGDEAYSRTTSTLLEFGRLVSESTSSFNITLTLNVLRDLGEGSVVLYDNDSVISVIDDWDSQDDERTIAVNGLAYDITHNFYAVYMGNSQCGKSQSKTITYELENTHRAKTTLTLSNTTRQFNPHASFTKTITLTNNSSDSGAAAYNKNQTIKIYYDNVLIETLSTLNSNTVSFDIEDGGNAGLHKLAAVFEGSSLLYAKTTTWNISVGYDLSIKDYSAIAVAGVSDSYSATLKDFLGNAISGKTVRLIANSTTQGTATTASNGVATITADVRNATSIKFGTTINNVTYYSEEASIKCITPNVTVTTSASRLYKEENNILTVDIGNEEPGVLVGLTGYVTKSVYTDSNGIATTTITGTGSSTDKTITATCGSSSSSKTLEDYNQYWEPGDVHNQSYYYTNGTVYALNNYFKMVINSGSSTAAVAQIFSIYDVKDNADYELIIEGLSTSKNVHLQYLHSCTASATSIDVGDNTITPSYTAHSNETWKIVRSGGTVTVYKNNTVITSHSSQNNYHPTFMIMNNNSSQVNLNFTKLTLRGGV